jgi:3-hydroxybutyryl-CoA dehydrogenase
MKLEDIKSIGVVGGGVMGSGIAQTTVLAGYRTIVRDVNDEIITKTKTNIIDGRWGFKGGLERGKLTQGQTAQAIANLSFTTSLNDLKDCDLIIEAIPENMELKQEVFADLDKTVKRSAIFASNSSALTHSAIAKAVDRKDRYIGMHWFSPANIMKLVELIYTPDTSKEVITLLEELCKQMGKVSIRVKDVPGNTGYVNNRIFRVVRQEARKIVDEGIATEEDVDLAMRLGRNWPAGPFESTRGARSGWV